MEQVRKYLKDFGFNEEDINNILETNRINKSLEETLLKHCIENNIFFLENNYTKEDIIKMIKVHPKLYSYSVETIKQKIEDIMSLGYTKEEVIKMAKFLPTLYYLTIENIKQKIEDMISLSYSKEEVIKMTKVCPSIYSYNIETMKQKIEDIMSLGYTKEEVIKMAKFLPTLYYLTIENIKQKIENMISLGYTREEVIKMTKNLPALYSLSIENIKQKIELLKEIDLEFIILENTKQLIQSADLTYARYKFLISKNQNVNRENYRQLFMNNKQFTKQFGIDKKELLE